ncbi:MAG: homoserine dehydrogenase [Aerococcaceae bacterium]|nr:homoserine dehydrogenase [Aerococcaceae bacterium]
MKIAILGMGTVGCGVLEALHLNQTKYEAAIGEPIEVVYLFAKHLNKAQHLDVSNYRVTNQFEELLAAELDLVIEVMGGIEFPKYAIEQFLQRGVHVVTANKDLLAMHIDELAVLANAHGALLMSEASVAGGIPILNAVATGLAGTCITSVMGILNGTTNYILDKMAHEQMSYQDALEEATTKGYAESDPTNDVEGFDARRKIALLSRLAYQTIVDVEHIRVQGITAITQEDVQFATENHLIFKLVGASRMEEDQLTISVEPVLLSNEHPLSTVRLANNAVYLEGNAVGAVMLSGPGAGGIETASAIWSDVLQVANKQVQTNLVPSRQLEVVAAQQKYAYYIRLREVTELAVQTIPYQQNEFQRMTEPINEATAQQLRQHASVALVVKVMSDEI